MGDPASYLIAPATSEAAPGGDLFDFGEGEYAGRHGTAEDNLSGDFRCSLVLTGAGLSKTGIFGIGSGNLGSVRSVEDDAGVLVDSLLGTAGVEFWRMKGMGLGPEARTDSTCFGTSLEAGL